MHKEMEACSGYGHETGTYVQDPRYFQWIEKYIPFDYDRILFEAWGDDDKVGVAFVSKTDSPGSMAVFIGHGAEYDISYDIIKNHHD